MGFVARHADLGRAGKPILLINRWLTIHKRLTGSNSMNADDLITLNEEIAGMARAGLPPDRGLKAMAGEMGRGRLQRVTAALAEDLRAGHPLPEALKRQGSRVPAFYAGLVEAGARTGRIGEVLATLTVYARSIAN